jgi:hypothetical protein
LSAGESHANANCNCYSNGNNHTTSDFADTNGDYKADSDATAAPDTASASLTS